MKIAKNLLLPIAATAALIAGSGHAMEAPILPQNLPKADISKYSYEKFSKNFSVDHILQNHLVNSELKNRILEALARNEYQTALLDLYALIIAHKNLT